MRCNECEASGLVEPCFCECCGRPLPSPESEPVEGAYTAETVSAPQDFLTESASTESGWSGDTMATVVTALPCEACHAPASPPHSSGQAGPCFCDCCGRSLAPASVEPIDATPAAPAKSCESCGAPTLASEELCAACTTMFASVLHDARLEPESPLATTDRVEHVEPLDHVETASHGSMWSEAFADPIHPLPVESTPIQSTDETWDEDAADDGAFDDETADDERELSLDEDDDAAGEAASAAPEPSSPTIVASAPTVVLQAPTLSADSTLHDEVEFPVVRQPWERKGETSDATASDAAGDDEPLPWWERQAAATRDGKATSDATVIEAARADAGPGGTVHAAPQERAAHPVASPQAAAPAGAPGSIPRIASQAPPAVLVSHARADDARRGAQPRAVPRPPVPGAVTRPVQQRPRTRPIYIVAGSLAVLVAMGVPLAKQWLRTTPTVTVTDTRDLASRPRSSGPASAPADTRPSARPAGSNDAPRRRDARSPTGAPAVTTRARADATPRHPASGKGDRASSAAAPRDVSASPSTSVVSAPPPAPEPAPAPAPPPPPPAAEPIAVVATGPVFEAGQVDDKPRVTSQVEPSVPEDLRDRALTDLVILRVLVSQSGRPSDVNLLRRSKAGAALDNAVVAAVRQWSFAPARRRGQAVNCWYNVGVPLRLEGRTSQ